MNIGIIFIGTGNYINYFSNYYDNCEKYFLPNTDKTYFCFTDADFEGEVPSNIKVIPTEHEPWPNPTLKRFHTILKEKDNYSDFDYLIYLDSDMLVNETINEDEILSDSDFIGVHHPGFYKKKQLMPYERRKNSEACINVDGEIYWQGCLWGGKTNSVLDLCETLSARIDKDFEKGIVAEWHDESHLNKFFLDNLEKVTTLEPEYAFPEVYDTDSNRDFNYPNIDPTKRKIIHLLKNHSEIRS
jgi:hypothetical protein